MFSGILTLSKFNINIRCGTPKRWPSSQDFWDILFSHTTFLYPNKYTSHWNHSCLLFPSSTSWFASAIRFILHYLCEVWFCCADRLFAQHRFKTSMIFSISPFLSFIGSHWYWISTDGSRAIRILKRLLVQMNPVQESRGREYPTSNTWICRVQLQPLSRQEGHIETPLAGAQRCWMGTCSLPPLDVHISLWRESWRLQASKGKDNKQSSSLPWVSNVCCARDRRDNSALFRGTAYGEVWRREENGTSQKSSLLTIHWIHPKGSITQDWNSTTIPPPFRSRTLERTQLCLQ